MIGGIQVLEGLKSLAPPPIPVPPPEPATPVAPKADLIKVSGGGHLSLLGLASEAPPVPAIPLVASLTPNPATGRVDVAIGEPFKSDDTDPPKTIGYGFVNLTHSPPAPINPYNDPFAGLPNRPPDWTLAAHIDQGKVTSVDYRLGYQAERSASSAPSEANPAFQSVRVDPDGRVRLELLTGFGLGFGDDGSGGTGPDDIPTVPFPIYRTQDLAPGESFGPVSRQGDNVTITTPSGEVITLRPNHQVNPSLSVNVQASSAPTGSYTAYPRDFRPRRAAS